jgi:hypothetical protein
VICRDYDEGKIMADIIFRGLKRSGNHAVIDWIRKDGDFFFINNLVPMGKFPDQALPEFDLRRLRLKQAIRTVVRERKFFDIRSRLATDLIVSVEDTPPNYMPFKTVSNSCLGVNLIRSFDNLLASRIKKAFATDKPSAYPRRNDVHMKRFVDLWISYAETALGQNADTTVWIYFDRWISDPDYRVEIKKRLGIGLPDRDLSRNVPRFGGGSSFSGTENIENFKGLSDRKSMLVGDEAVLFQDVYSEVRQKIDPLMARLAVMTQLKSGINP